METLCVPLPSPDELAALGARERGELLTSLERAIRRVEAVVVDTIDVADRTGDGADDGHRSTRAWVVANTNCSPGEARARVRTARALRDLPAVSEALHGGLVGIAQVREIARLAGNPRSGHHIAGPEAVLLDAARQLDYRAFKIVTRRWEQCADPDGAAAEHDATEEYRDARVVEVGGEFRFETSHGPIAGTMMRDVFEAFVAAEWDRDWQACVAEHGDAASAALMARTAHQRRADAFTEMVLAAAAAGIEGSVIETTVNLISDLEQFEQRIAGETADVPVAVDPASVRGRRCETTDGVPVDPRQIVAAAILGRIRHIVVDGAGVIVAAGQKRRLFDGALREAIRATDPVCGWLGCSLRAMLSEIDHLRPAARGGPTDAANGKIMCKRHNLFKQHAKYLVERLPDGTILITRPDGTHLRQPDAA